MTDISPQDNPLPATGNDISVGRLLGIGLATRLLIDTGVQIFFPFMPIIAQGMGLSTVIMGRLISLRSLMGLFSPLFGTMAERRGYRYTMRLSLLLVGSGFFMVGMSRSIWLAAPGMALVGLGSFSFVPTLQAYLSNRLPYHQRARGLGILEYAWALSGIVGLYLVGQMLNVVSWQLPFFIMGGCLLIASMLYTWLPSVHTESMAETAVPPSAATHKWQTLINFFDLGSNNRSAFATVITGCLLMFGAFDLFINYGTWLFADFGLTAAGLGQVALVMGLADLCGSVSVSMVSDRYGKRRSVLTGAIIACIGFWTLPFLATTLITAVIGLIIARSAFEFAIVANMTLLSEQAPSQRAKLMTLGAAFSVLSTGLAGLTGPWTFEQWGLMGMSAISGSAMLFSIFILLWGVREPETTVHTKQS